MTASVPIDWKPGDVILDQYEVIGELGIDEKGRRRGGMGIVYRVHHRGWNVDLAMKCPQPERFASEGGKKNFIHEAETWVNLQLHPNVVACYYVRTIKDIPHLFAEYVDGESLSHWIHSPPYRLYEGGHKQALERILDVAIQFAWGLDAAHVVHQDVKPANVMMTLDGAAKVTDFGLAKARAMAGEGTAQQGSGKQSILVSWGGMTRAYCSPEQAALQPLSRKTDIWSWGVSVLEMFVGDVSWSGGEAAAGALARHKTCNAMIPPMPAEVVKLLARCFQLRPENRPATMQEVASEVQAIYASLLGNPYPREAPRPSEFLGDSLNNRALSLYDLGKIEEAKQAWDQALQADPQHLEATYNQGVLQWREGKLTDDELTQRVEALFAGCPAPWRVSYLLAQIHLERGDVQAGLALLREADRQAPGTPEVDRLLTQTRTGRIPDTRCLHIMGGHRGAVTSVHLSLDGCRALSGAEDGTVRLWDTASGEGLDCFVMLGEHGFLSLEGTRVRLSADGSRALVISSATEVWDLKRRCRLRSFKFRSALLSANGRFVLSGGLGDPMQLWDVEHGHCLRAFRGSGRGALLDLSTDGHIALEGSSSFLYLWDMESERCLSTIPVGPRMVHAASLSSDGNQVVSGSADGLVRLWDTWSGECKQTLKGHKGTITSVGLSADGHLVCSGSQDKTVRVWDVASERCLHTLTEHAAAVTAISMSPDGRRILSGSQDGIVRVWEVSQERFPCSLHLSQVWSPTKVSQVQIQAEGLLQSAERAIEGRRIDAALESVRQARALPGWERSLKTLRVWDHLARYCAKAAFRSGWQQSTFEGHTREVRAVALSADGRLALSGGADGTVRVWEVASGKPLHILKGHRGEVRAVALSADGSRALSGGADGTVRVWDAASGEALQILKGHKREVLAVCLSANGRLALSGGWDKPLCLWDVERGRCLRRLKAYRSGTAMLGLSADGCWALSAETGSNSPIRIQLYAEQVTSTGPNADGQWVSRQETGGGLIRLWDMASKRCLHTYAEQATSMSLSADGRWALLGSGDKVLFWDLASREERLRLPGHTGPVQAVTLSADRHLALSGSRDGTVRLWDIKHERCLCTLEGHRGGVNAVCLSPDGHRALSGGQDGVVRLWVLDWDLEAREPANWDEGARPLLENFLRLHIPTMGRLPLERDPSKQEIQQALTRQGKPTWTEQDFQELLQTLRRGGYGWLRPAGVRCDLEMLAASWQESLLRDNSTGVISGKEAGRRKIPSQQDQDASVKADVLALTLVVGLLSLPFLPGLLFDCFGIPGVLGIWQHSWGVFWASFACTLPLSIAATVGRKGWLRSLSRLLLSSAWGLAGWLLGSSVPIVWLSWILRVIGGLLGLSVGQTFHAKALSSRDDRYS